VASDFVGPLLRTQRAHWRWRDRTGSLEDFSQPFGGSNRSLSPYEHVADHDCEPWRPFDEGWCMQGERGRI